LHDCANCTSSATEAGPVGAPVPAERRVLRSLYNISFESCNP